MVGQEASKPTFDGRQLVFRWSTPKKSIKHSLLRDQQRVLNIVDNGVGKSKYSLLDSGLHDDQQVVQLKEVIEMLVF